MLEVLITEDQLLQILNNPEDFKNLTPSYPPATSTYVKITSEPHDFRIGHFGVATIKALVSKFPQHKPAIASIMLMQFDRLVIDMYDINTLVETFPENREQIASILLMPQQFQELIKNYPPSERSPGAISKLLLWFPQNRDQIAAATLGQLESLTPTGLEGIRKLIEMLPECKQGMAEFFLTLPRFQHLTQRTPHKPLLPPGPERDGYTQSLMQKSFECHIEKERSKLQTLLELFPEDRETIANFVLDDLSEFNRLTQNMGDLKFLANNALPQQKERILDFILNNPSEFTRITPHVKYVKLLCNEVFPEFKERILTFILNNPSEFKRLARYRDEVLFLDKDVFPGYTVEFAQLLIKMAIFNPCDFNSLISSQSIYIDLFFNSPFYYELYLSELLSKSFEVESNSFYNDVVPLNTPVDEKFSPLEKLIKMFPEYKEEIRKLILSPEYFAQLAANNNSELVHVVNEFPQDIIDLAGTYPQYQADLVEIILNNPSILDKISQKIPLSRLSEAFPEYAQIFWNGDDKMTVSDVLTNWAALKANQSSTPIIAMGIFNNNLRKRPNDNIEEISPEKKPRP